MRLRLVHSLSLALLSAVVVSVVAMGGFTAWNLRQGFAAYVQSRDVQRLESFVRVVIEALDAGGDAGVLTEGRTPMRSLVDEVLRREGLRGPPRDGPPRDGPFRDGPPRDGPPRDGPPRDGPPGAGPPRDGRPPPGAGRRLPEDAFAARVVLLDPAGRLLLGRPLAQGPLPFVDRSVRWRGEVVAIARLRPVGGSPEANDLDFLRSQYLGIVGVAAALVLVAIGAAVWLARRWTSPLAEVQAATARIARGELSVRLPTTRDDEIGDVMRNVDAMAEALQRMEGARRRWVADIAHELRTPLSGLRGEVEAMLDGVRPLTTAAIGSLREEVLRLGALVDDLHLLAMSDLNAMPCRWAEADAIDLMREAQRRFETRAQTAGLVLSLDAPAGPAAVRWDPARIAQLLSNLLENAVRYTDAPGRIELAVRADAQRVRIRIDDTAPGVSPADLPRLFEPLWRADVSRARHAGGSGLGLAICEAIVRAHEGEISAARSPQGGLRIDVVLPRRPGRAAE
jgi:two-component system sensor histidine kinase BaeS